MNYRILLDKRRAKKDGTYPVVVDMTFNSKTIRVSIGQSCLPSDWDESSMSFNRKLARKNALLNGIKSKLDMKLLEIESSGIVPRKNEMNEIIAAIANPVKHEVRQRKKERMFSDYVREFADTKSNPGTRDLYLLTARKVSEYDPECKLDDITPGWLRDFERSMERSGMKVNAYAIHLRNIRAVINYCIDEEYTDKYPFRKFKIKKEDTLKRCLTVEQLRLLRDYECEEHLKRYRDMFLLMFYLIGINGADLFLAKRWQLINGRLEYRRKKTGRLYSVLVPEEAMAIIKRYEGKEYLLNIMDEYSNYKNFLNRMDRQLKNIGTVERKGLGGKKHYHPLYPCLSSYWSRHTWATIAASLDVPKETISEALGHEIGCSTTSIYIKFDQRKVDEANRRVIDYVNGDNESECNLRTATANTALTRRQRAGG